MAQTNLIITTIYGRTPCSWQVSQIVKVLKQLYLYVTCALALEIPIPATWSRHCRCEKPTSAAMFTTKHSKHVALKWFDSWIIATISDLHDSTGYRECYFFWALWYLNRFTTMRFIHGSQNHGKPTAIDSSEAGAQREPPCREWAVTLKLIRLKYIAEHLLTDWLIDDMTSVIQNFNVNQQSWYWQPRNSHISWASVLTWPVTLTLCTQTEPVPKHWWYTWCIKCFRHPLGVTISIIKFGMKWLTHSQILKLWISNFIPHLTVMQLSNSHYNRLTHVSKLTMLDEVESFPICSLCTW